MKKKKITKNILAHITLTILAVIWVMPLIWIILTSFRAQKGAYTSSFFPKAYTLDNYTKLFTDTGILNFPRMFENTLIVAVFSCIISTFFVLSVAYCMSRLRFRMRKAMMNVATKWQVFTRITIPLSKPIIVYTVLTSFIAPWVDFIFARVICRANANYYTVAIGLWQMLEKEYVDVWYTRFAAGAVLISIPIAALFMIMQRCYNDSMSGAVKG